MAVLEAEKTVEYFSDALVKITSFLEQHSNLVNVCMVDFITEDIFSKCVSGELQANLLALSEEDVRNMPDLLLNQEELGW